MAPPRESPVEPRLQEGPVYELRTYIAAQERFEHLVKRFREHTDRLFRAHSMQPFGYWVPTEGPPISKRTLVYLLKHASRYEAWKNWVAFTNDPEWQNVLDQPLFQRLIIGKPESVFMTQNAYSDEVSIEMESRGGIFELRTYTAEKRQLSALNARLRKHTAASFTRHGMKNIADWTPFDSPHSSNQLFSLLHHASREQADASWKALINDADWQEVAKDSKRNGKLLVEPPQRLLLRALDFSPLQESSDH
jgi:hypothetical protein